MSYPPGHAYRLHQEALALGLEIKIKAISNRLAPSGGGETPEQVRARLHAEADYRRALAEHGITRTQIEASSDLRLCGWSGTAAAERVIAGRQRSRQRRAKPCTVPFRSSSVRRAQVQAVRCGCARCEEWLIEAFRPFLSSMAHRRPWLHDVPDFRQEAAMCVGKLIETWDGRVSLHAYYAVIVINRAKTILDHETAAARKAPTVSLDEPIVGAGQGDGYVTYAERIPDRTIDVVTIVELRERLRDAVNAARDRVAAAGTAYDMRAAA